MLLAERAESERLRQIIKELQRHRFGRRAESLPEDQLLLGLEEAEQVEAAGHAQAEEAAPAEKTARSAKRRVNRGALPAHLPRVETLVDVDEHDLPVLLAAPCTASARTCPSASTSCRPSSGCWSSAARSTPAAPVRMGSCRRPRRPG